jgi:hypothetical protein
MTDRKVVPVIFRPAGLFTWVDETRLVGLDEDETKEFLALMNEGLALLKAGGPRFRNSRYWELWEKYDRAALLAGFQTPKGDDPQ